MAGAAIGCGRDGARANRIGWVAPPASHNAGSLRACHGEPEARVIMAQHAAAGGKVSDVRQRYERRGSEKVRTRSMLVETPYPRARNKE